MSRAVSEEAETSVVEVRLLAVPVALWKRTALHHEALNREFEIILAGLPATFFYNLCAAALRAVGNTRYALFFLMIAVAVNVGLTFVLVVLMGWGITGAAWATYTTIGQSPAY